MNTQTKPPVSSTDRQKQILAQAKSVMDNFFESLSKAKIKEQSIGIVRSNQTRKPSTSKKDESFKTAMFSNAPNKDIDYIIAEKKHW